MKTKPATSAKINKVSADRGRTRLTAVRGAPAPRRSPAIAASPLATVWVIGAVMIVLEMTLILVTRYLSVTTGKNFFTEGTFFTMFSTMQMVGVGLIALVIAALAYSSNQGRGGFYGWASAGVFAFFLAFDEWFEVHEAVAKHSGALYKSLSIPLKPSYWDAPFFLVYLAIAGIVWFAVKDDLVETTLSKLSISGAGLSLALSISFDMGMHRVLPVAWEDGFKLIGFMLIGLAFAAVAVNRYSQARKTHGSH